MMTPQQKTIAQPAQPSAPVIAGSTAPRTQSQIDQLDLRRNELKSQLSSLTERRVLLSVQMRDADAGARAQLQARIKALDDRTARIDEELNGIDDAMNKLLSGVTIEMPPIPAIPALAPVQGRPGITILPPGSSRMAGAVERVMIMNGVGFLIILFALWRWGRRRGQSAPTKLGSEDAARIDQLQRSVDVIAVEVERISESQRFLAKVLNEKSLGAGAAQEIATGRREAEPVRKAEGR